MSHWSNIGVCVFLWALVALAAASPLPKSTIRTLTLITPPGPDTTPPLIAILMPVAGAEVSAGTTMLVAIEASDTVGITRLAVTINGQPLCVLFAPPYRCPWPIPAQANVRYTINAMAIDQVGNNAQSQVDVIAK